MPSTATSSETLKSIDGTDAQAGQPGVALGPAPEAVEDVRATAPVARDQEHDERGRHERAGGRADRLSERGAAGRLRAI